MKNIVCNITLLLLKETEPDSRDVSTIKEYTIHYDMTHFWKRFSTVLVLQTEHDQSGLKNAVFLIFIFVVCAILRHLPVRKLKGKETVYFLTVDNQPQLLYNGE